MSQDDPPAVLPSRLVASIERQCDGRIDHVLPRAGGGASRQGAEVRLIAADGRAERGYLSYDSRVADPRRIDFFRREVAILAALSGPLADQGVRAPRLIAHDADHLALLTTFAPGSDRYAPGTSQAERDSVERDLVAQLVALHTIDPAAIALDGFDDPARSVADRIRARLAELRAEILASAPDAILLLAIGWLEANVPIDRGPSVIVHGDAGPGNFLHADGRVTALLDWELVHFGDPMEDLAQIWVRSLFSPFLSPRAVFEAYEAAGGVSVDVDRVRFHRLYFQVGFTVSSHGNLYGADESVRPAVLGTTMLFYTAHMRVIVRSLAELMGVTLPPVALPEPPTTLAARSYDIALEDLRDVIVPRAGDQQARAKATSLARLVKYWRSRDRYSGMFEAVEIGEIVAALGKSLATLADARRALALAVAERRIDPEIALRLSHARMVRETALMGDAMGSLRDCWFPPLDPA